MIRFLSLLLISAVLVSCEEEKPERISNKINILGTWDYSGVNYDIETSNYEARAYIVGKVIYRGTFLSRMVYQSDGKSLKYYKYSLPSYVEEAYNIDNSILFFKDERYEESYTMPFEIEKDVLTIITDETKQYYNELKGENVKGEVYKVVIYKHYQRVK